ncbi:hypothetical protein HDV05_002222, partial [Chytridiales sp. JEL 0842]
MYDKLCVLRPDLCFKPEMNEDLILIADASVEGMEEADNRDINMYNVLQTASECLINIPIRRQWQDKLRQVFPLVEDIIACYFTLDEIVVQAAPRLQRALPYLSAEDEHDRSRYIIYPTEYLLIKREFERVERLITSGFK